MICTDLIKQFDGSKKSVSCLQSSVEIVILSGAAAATAVSFYKINPLAGQLFIPYLAWLAFASALNITYYKLNPDSSKAIEAAKDK